MVDNNGVLQALVTKTATFQSATYGLGTGTPTRGLGARFILTDYKSTGTAGAVWTPSIEHSSDGTTWSTLAAAPPITCGTASGTKEVGIKFGTNFDYIRSVMTLTTSSGTPTVSYLADITLEAN